SLLRSGRLQQTFCTYPIDRRSELLRFLAASPAPTICVRWLDQPRHARSDARSSRTQRHHSLVAAALVVRPFSLRTPADQPCALRTLDERRRELSGVCRTGGSCYQALRDLSFARGSSITHHLSASARRAHTAGRSTSRHPADCLQSDHPFFFGSAIGEGRCEDPIIPWWGRFE